MKNTGMILVLLVFLVSCDLFNDGGTVNADQFDLSSQGEVILLGDTVDFYEETSDSVAKLAKFAKNPKDIGYDVVLAARIPAVNVDGYNVQANTIEIHGNTAFIAYNYAGEPFRGAIQIVDISQKGEPEITDEIRLSSMDVNALYVDGSDLIFGGAADPDIWGYKSFIGKINMNSISADSMAASVTALPSHAVTGITKKGGTFYVTVGAAGGKLVTLDDVFDTLGTVDLPDGRDIQEYQNGVILIAGTTDSDETAGKVVLVPSNDQAITEISVPDFGSDYHKATIEVFEGNTALLAMSEASFKVLDLDDGTFLYEAANPDMPDGLPYTNSVSSDSDLIFSANGEWGFRVFTVQNKKFDETALAGYYPFEGLTDSLDQNYSANHVEYKSGHLFVASGVGGVQVFTLDKK